MVLIRTEIQTPFDIGLRVQMGVIFLASVVSWYNSSMVSTFVRVWCWYNKKSMVSILVRARVLYTGHALLESSYGSAVTELTTLCHRPSRAFSSLSVALKACSCVFVVVLVVTAVCGQRGDALSTLVVRFLLLGCRPEGMLLRICCGVGCNSSMQSES